MDNPLDHQPPLLEAKEIVKEFGDPRALVSNLLHCLRTGRVKPWRRVLDGVDFVLRPGETVGILGSNGAGKTTLLSILAGIIKPTSGSVRVNCRIAPFLELGTGFEQTATGRENAVLFCRSYGLAKADITKRVEAIEAFTDLGPAFDQPIRSYSSGMHSRLAFGCAINVDADVVILDETLAVGDANFRAKCYQEIRRLQERGMSFLLVSHAPDTLATLSTRIVVLQDGKLAFEGPPYQAVMAYKRLRAGLSANASEETAPVRLENIQAPSTWIVGAEEFRLAAELVVDQDVSCPVINFGILTASGEAISAISSEDILPVYPSLARGDRLPVECVLAARLLPGSYFISSMISSRTGEDLTPIAVYGLLHEFKVVGEGFGSGLLNLRPTLSVVEATPVSIQGGRIV